MTKSGSKRIVIVGPAHPLRGGIAVFNERLALEFIKEGHEVYIYSFSLQYPSILFPGKSQYTTEPAPANLTIRTKINSINPINWWITGSEIAKLRPDIFICKFWLPFMGPALGTLMRRAKKSGAKCITIVDNIIPHEKRPGDKLFTNYFIKPVNAFVVMSEKVENDLRSFDISVPIRKVPHPIYDNFGPLVSRSQSVDVLKLDQDQRYVLFFGFIRAYKGLDMLLHAFRNSELQKRKIKLLVAGEFYDNEEKYWKVINDYDLHDQVIMHTDFIPVSKVKYYFGASDVLALPYKSATQSGITQMGLHFEIPMISTNVGGLPEIVKDDKMGLVTNPSSAEIALAILQFFDEGKAEQYIEGVKGEKKRYQWSRMTSTILSLAELNPSGIQEAPS